MQEFIKNKFIRNFLENFSFDIHFKILKHLIIIGFDYIRDIGILNNDKFFFRNIKKNFQVKN